MMNPRGDEAPSALAFEGVGFAYGGRGDALVVEGVGAALAPGEMVALIGPNGAGKSTLLRLASGVLRPLVGRVRVAGEDVRRVARREMARRVAVVPQDFSVPFAYTVRQIVEMGRLAHADGWGTPRAGDRAAVAAALAETDTAAFAGRIFNELSGGERQRVLIALALAQGSPLLLLDEPTAHLDIKHQIEVLELLRRLNRERGLTVFAVLHDLNLAARYFPRLMLFRRRIVADGPPTRVLDGALLSRIYETPVRVGILRGEEHLSVLPPGTTVGERALAADGAAAMAARVHALAGGGSGELLMRTLADAGVPFTAGPLNVGDSDAALAERLALKIIAEPPYASVSPQGLAATREWMATAGAVVVCPMPLGHGNVALVEMALEARRAGMGVALLEPAAALEGEEPGEAALRAVAVRDFSGQGAAFYRELLDAGARLCATPGEVLVWLAASPREGRA